MIINKKKLIIIASIIAVVGAALLSRLYSSGFSAPAPYFPEQNDSIGTFVDNSPPPPIVTPTPVATPAIQETPKIEPPYKIEPVEEQTIPEDERKEAEKPSEQAPSTPKDESQDKKQSKAFDAIRESKLITDEQLVAYLYSEELLKNKAEMPSRSKLIEELMLRLNSIDEYAANEAAIVLEKSVTEIDAQSLAEAIQTGGYSEFSVMILVRILGKLKDPRVFKTLYDEFKRVTNERIRDEIIIAFGELGDERAISILLSVINASKRDVKQFYSKDSKALAMAAMAKIGTPRAKGAFDTGIDEMISADILKHIRLTKTRFEDIIDPARIDSTVIPGQARQELFYKGTRYLLYVPTKRKNDYSRTRVLVCVHNEDIDFEEVFETCRNAAKKYKFAVLTPIFETIDYPFYGTLNLSGQRPDLRLWEILKHLSQYAALDIREIFLYGEGRGGLFVQSFSLVYNDRVGRALFFSESMIKPDKNEIFPMGIGETPWAPEIKIEIEKYIKSDVALMIQRGIGKRAPSMKVLKEYLKIAEDRGVTPRIGFREYKVGAKDDHKAARQEVIESYLFEGL